MKIAVITGASDGIGRAVAEKLPKNGFHVCLVSRSEDNLKKAQKEIKKYCVDAKGVDGCDYFVCDITDSKKVEETIKNIVKKYKTIDLLVNNAGIWIEGELDSHTSDEIKRAMDTNATGHLFVTKEVIPIMKKQKSGTIVNVVSQAGLSGKEERAVYNAAKFAMTGATKCLQLDLRKYGIRVIGIYPAKVRTKLFEKANIKKPMDNALTQEQVADAILFAVMQPKDVEISDIVLRNIRN